MKESVTAVMNENYYNKRSLKIIFWPAIRQSKRSDMPDCFPSHEVSKQKKKNERVLSTHYSHVQRV